MRGSIKKESIDLVEKLLKSIGTQSGLAKNIGGKKGWLLSHIVFDLFLIAIIL